MNAHAQNCRYSWPMVTKACLSELRVVEVGSLPAGAYAARLFADFGADVIKVEPSEGDPTRHFPPLIDGGSGWFAYLNFGKKSVTSDKTDLAALLAGADVLIDSTGIERSHPSHLVAVDLSWFGKSGPYRVAGPEVAKGSAGHSRASCS